MLLPPPFITDARLLIWENEEGEERKRESNLDNKWRWQAPELCMKHRSPLQSWCELQGQVQILSTAAGPLADQGSCWFRGIGAAPWGTEISVETQGMG